MVYSISIVRNQIYIKTQKSKVEKRENSTNEARMCGSIKLQPYSTRTNMIQLPCPFWDEQHMRVGSVESHSPIVPQPYSLTCLLKLERAQSANFVRTEQRKERLRLLQKVWKFHCGKIHWHRYQRKSAQILCVALWGLKSTFCPKLRTPSTATLIVQQRTVNNWDVCLLARIRSVCRSP